MTAATRPRPPKSSSPAQRAQRPPLDPRLRERRIAVIRAQGRRRLRVLLAALALLVTLAGVWVVVWSPFFDVDHIVVKGAEHTPASDARAASGVRGGDSLLLVDTGAAARRIEKLPWVAQARVEAHLPGEMEIGIVERTPVAWAHRGDRVALVDADGRVLGAVIAPPPRLPELAGVDRVPPPGRTVRPSGALRVPGAVPPELRARVRAVQVRGAEVALELVDGPEIRLGRPDHVAVKGQAALAVLGAEPNAHLAYVDVRVPTSPVSGESA